MPLPIFNLPGKNITPDKQMALMRTYLNQLKDDTEAELYDIKWDNLSKPLREKIEGLDRDIVAVKDDTNAILANYVNAAYLEANYLSASQIAATYIAASVVEANYATFGYLSANYATLDYLSANYADFSWVNSNFASFSYLSSNYATIGSLSAQAGRIDDLVSRTATIERLYVNSAQVGSIVNEYLLQAQYSPFQGTAYLGNVYAGNLYQYDGGTGTYKRVPMN